jgi:single-strand DNA-binding protein
MFTQLVRIGRDAELRTTQNGESVCSLACAYDIGFGDRKETVWISGALWGKRAESLVHYLKKGIQAMIVFDDVKPEIYNEKASLKGRIVEIKLCGKKPEQSSQAPIKPRPAPVQQQATDFDDDIPF